MTAAAEPVGPRRRLIGASLISAAGSLPLHLLPVTIAAIVAGTAAATEIAGLIAPALLIGQLLASTALPILGVSTVTRGWAAILSVALVAGTLLSGVGGVAGLLGGWFCVGLSCGGLIFLGTTTAAHFKMPELAFALRLGVVLVVSGVCTGLVQVTGASGDYDGYLVWLAIAFAAILGVGNLLYAPVAPPLPTSAPDDGSRFTATMGLGLAAVFVLFVGQTGLVAYVLVAATDRGMELANAAWVFAA
ncbi:MAG: hypothetical protein RLO01_04390 [Thalassobaculaceae bacterium]